MTLTTAAEHKAAVKEFRTLATDEEAHYAQLLVLRDAIHAFEEANGHNPGPPTTVAGRLQVEMFKRHLKQKQLAQLLEVGESRLSEVLRGRRPANGDFLRRMYQKWPRLKVWYRCYISSAIELINKYGAQKRAFQGTGCLLPPGGC